MIKDVAYNTGGTISGTTQVNDIAIATDNNPDYTEGSWVGGVDSSDGYVIVSDTTSANLVGRTTGGGAGWLFYSDEGNINALAPTADGNAIFLINGSPKVETYNPNKTNGVNEIYFNLSDSAGTDYTTQFTALQTNGGTITMTQGVNIATYTSVIPGTFFVDGASGFFVMQTGPATQTVTSASPFVSGVPITLSFS